MPVATAATFHRWSGQIAGRRRLVFDPGGLPTSPEAVAAQDDGPSWYFLGFPLGLEVFQVLLGPEQGWRALPGKPRLAGRAEQDQLPFASQADRNTERSGVFLSLETKFLLFEAGQKRDSVLSRSTGGRAFNWLRLWVRPVRPWPRARPRHRRGQLACGELHHGIIGSALIGHTCSDVVFRHKMLVLFLSCCAWPRRVAQHKFSSSARIPDFYDRDAARPKLIGHPPSVL